MAGLIQVKAKFAAAASPGVPLFFFHLREGDLAIPDYEGRTLSSLADAREHARKSALSILAAVLERTGELMLMAPS